MKKRERAHTSTATDRSFFDTDYSKQVQDIFDLQREEILQISPPVLIALGLLISLSGSIFDEFIYNLYLGLLLEFLAFGIWIFNRRWPRFAVWTLMLGLIFVLFIVARTSTWNEVFWLLILPVGLTGLAIGRIEGTILAFILSLSVLLAPLSLLPLSSEIRWTATIGMWGVVGMVWLMLRPTLTAVGWAWSSYRRSEELLEQARDYQMQLKEALKEMQSTNLQLQRLNQQARRLQLAAENAQRAKQQFVTNVSHELRTPLNMIIGFCEMITQYPDTYGWNIPQALLDDLNVIQRNARHLADLINDVLDLSQIESGQMKLNREYVSLPEIIDAATVVVQPLFTSKSLYLHIDLAPDLPPIYVDPLRIREVIINLLSNAGRFTEKGGVTLRAWREEKDIVVSVKDTGPGIAPKDREKVFEPFYQADGSLRRRHGGTGLGLSISRKFIEMHGGTIWFESEPGSGTVFHFRLPVEAMTIDNA